MRFAPISKIAGDPTAGPCCPHHHFNPDFIIWHAGAMVQVKLGKVLGEGTFGTTYMGRWRGGDVAVKCVRIQQRDEAESFLREVHVLACVRHPNVMPFYGRHTLDTILLSVLAEHSALVLQVEITSKSCAAASQPVTCKLTEMNLRCMQKYMVKSIHHLFQHCSCTSCNDSMFWFI